MTEVVYPQSVALDSVWSEPTEVGQTYFQGQQGQRGVPVLSQFSSPG